MAEIEPETGRLAFFGASSTPDIQASGFGTKAAGLAKLCRAGIRVPPGFSLHVSLCEEYFRNGEVLPADLEENLTTGIRYLERVTSRKLGERKQPLVVSVRSGAPVSMPGIMETVLNLGMNRDVARGLVERTGNPRFAWDTYRRYLQSAGQVILAIPARKFDSVLRQEEQNAGLADERFLDSMTLKVVCSRFEELIDQNNPSFLSRDPFSHLVMACAGVFRSFEAPRARAIRSQFASSVLRGTAVTVQQMIFGNYDHRSGSGVFFTRDPSSGDPGPFIDFRFGAQGTDIVSGEQAGFPQEQIAKKWPDLFREIIQISRTIEAEFHDMQDVEFTVQEGVLFLLQTRPGKRTDYAALRIAVELFREGLVGQGEALSSLRNVDLHAISITRVVSTDPPVMVGTGASYGAAAGRIILSPACVTDERGDDPLILIQDSVGSDDIPLLHHFAGLVTVRGARTSHVAVVARQMGIACITSCPELVIDLDKRQCRFGAVSLDEGDWITVDGQSGAIFPGNVTITSEKPEELLSLVRSWQDLR